MDFILNGQGHGDVGSILMEHNFDPNALRPWRGDDGNSYVTTVQNGEPVTQVSNAPALLRKDEWKALDAVVIKVAKERLKLFGDLRSKGLSYSVPNGMGTTVLQHETQTDISAAELNMEGTVQGQNDQPVFALANLPLPIVHKDFQISARRIATSRQLGAPIDASVAEGAARRCGETVEQLTSGTYGTYAFGGGTIYGYTNHPSRVTKTLTTPTGLATNVTTLAQVLDMRQASMDIFYYGPWTLYCSTAWAEFLDNDYSASKSDLTLRERILKINGITACEDADFLSNYDMVLVQNTSDVARAVVGMEITTLQWPSMGGMMQNFKVMGILVPQIRTDSNSSTGLVHGSV